MKSYDNAIDDLLCTTLLVRIRAQNVDSTGCRLCSRKNVSACC